MADSDYPIFEGLLRSFRSVSENSECTGRAPGENAANTYSGLAAGSPRHNFERTKKLGEYEEKTRQQMEKFQVN